MNAFLPQIVVLGLALAGLGTYLYRRKNAPKWSDKSRNTFDFAAGLVFFVAAAILLVLGMQHFNAEVKGADNELAASCRALWKQVKPRELGEELTSIGLDQLRVHVQHDSDATRAALGDEEYYQLLEKIALDDMRRKKMDELQKQMTKATAELDQLSGELKASTRRLEKLEELQPAMKAFQEGRRIAPPGNYQLEVQIKRAQADASEVLLGALLRTRLECLRADSHTNKDGVETYVFLNLAKPYAEAAQKRLQDAGASATVRETAK